MKTKLIISVIGLLTLSLCSACVSEAERQRIEAEKQRQAEIARVEAEKAEKERQEREAKEAVERAERERLARIEAERLEKERQEREAKEAAERAERERLEREREAKEAAERAEQERLARIEAERLEKERQEREAKEAAERAERERLEREREAKEAAERAEQERLARIEAERLEKERLEREAKEAAERAERERIEALHTKVDFEKQIVAIKLDSILENNQKLSDEERSRGNALLSAFANEHLPLLAEKYNAIRTKCLEADANFGELLAALKADGLDPNKDETALMLYKNLRNLHASYWTIRYKITDFYSQFKIGVITPEELAKADEELAPLY